MPTQTLTGRLLWIPGQSQIQDGSCQITLQQQPDGSYRGRTWVEINLLGGEPPEPPAPSQYLVEQLAGSHLMPVAPSGPIPTRGVSFADPISGYNVTRLTDVADIVIVPDVSINEGLPWTVDGNPKAGFYNGYSRWSNVNVTGEYMIAFRTNNHSSLYTTAGVYVGPIVPNANHALGEGAELRWNKSGVAGTETEVFYVHYGVMYKQDVLIGHTSAEVIFDFNVHGGFQHTGDMDSSEDARYWAIRTKGIPIPGTNPVQYTELPRCVVLDAVTKTLLPGYIEQTPNGLDISPNGEWMAVVTYSTDPLKNFRFYRIADLALGDTTKPVYLPKCGQISTTGARAGHNGWAFDKLGNAGIFYQDNDTDWFGFFNPDTATPMTVTNTTELEAHLATLAPVAVLRLPQLGSYYVNQHIGRMPASKPGWAMMSTYGRDDSVWSYNQLLMIEIAPSTESPRIWRLGQTFCKRWDENGVDVGGYFSEAFASIDLAGQAIYWGSNWGLADNLEVYRLDLPAGWETEVIAE